MKYVEYKMIIKEDRKVVNSNISHIGLYTKNCGYQIITHFRRCQFYKTKKLLFPLYLTERFIYRKKCIKYGCDIPSGIHIGKGFRIDHPWGIVINSKVSIGDYCTIKTGVVIGRTEKGVPIIGNNVLLGAHSIVIGNVYVNDNSNIGAGAIVVKDVPKNSTVICDGAHVIDRGD